MAPQVGRRSAERRARSPGPPESFFIAGAGAAILDGGSKTRRSVRRGGLSAALLGPPKRASWPGFGACALRRAARVRRCGGCPGPRPLGWGRAECDRLPLPHPARGGGAGQTLPPPDGRRDSEAPRLLQA